MSDSDCSKEKLVANDQNNLLQTTTVGSYAMPGWLFTAAEAMKRGEYGSHDIEETLNDATDIAINDQLKAGIDILVDGEMRRLDFVMGFYDHLQGVRLLPPRRTLGPEGHDMRPKWQVLEPIQAPEGLRTVPDFRYLQRATADTGKSLKATVPGPFTLSGRLDPGTVYQNRMEVAWALVPIVNQELRELAKTGAAFIQIDEPSFAVYPERVNDYVALWNATVEGVNAKLAMHTCFGNYRCKPVGKRLYRPLFPSFLDAKVDQFILEFANREMAELELLGEIAGEREIGAGVVDVKSYYIEKPADVAERIRLLLKYVDPTRLQILPDCGFSQTARWAAFAKMQAMVAGTKIVRREIAGE
jgi:5-methyltetrahydropteroyltriglutamate--homocysteine methyltransferase